MAAAACLLWPGAAAPVVLTPPAAEPAALTQPAVMAPKAGGAAMLAVALAGPRLVAVGERGIILVSDDGGARWRQVPAPVGVTLTALQFVDARHGWAVGHMGVVLHSADGGLSWVKQLDGVRAAALTLAAARRQAGAPGAAAAAALAAARRLVADGPDKPFLDVHFDDARTGYALGAFNQIFRTGDGGASWQPWQAHVPNPRGLHLYGLRRIGAALYLVGEQGLLLKSGDDGASFHALASPYPGSLFGVVGGAAGEIVVFGLRGNAFWSADGGLGWHRIDTGTGAALSAGVALARGALVLVSQGGDVLLSTDRARSFQPLPAGRLGWTGVAQLPAVAGQLRLLLSGMQGVRRVAFAMPGAAR